MTNLYCPRTRYSATIILFTTIYTVYTIVYYEKVAHVLWVNANEAQEIANKNLRRLSC